MNQMLMAFSVTFAISSAMAAILYFQYRRVSRKARMKYRLLMKDAEGVPIWRTVHGKCLLGWPSGKNEIRSGEWDNERPTAPGTWAVIEAAKGKLVVCHWLTDNETIQVYDSWRELEAAVPASIFEKALVAAGIKKPVKYREEPLEL